MGKEVVAYDVAFDRSQYKNQSLEAKDSMRDAYTKRQIETHIGERFNVLLSESRYNIYSGTIFAENMTEPFLDMMIRGRDYRKIHGDPIDHPREEAEVEGFRKIQQELGRHDASVGSMMVSISPPGQNGSIYTHNFYDIFTLKQDEKGSYIQARRYSSSLSTTEYLQKVWELQPDAQEAFLWASDAHFLAHPLFFEPGVMDADGIHRALHKEHSYMSQGEFARILQECKPFIEEYINSLKNYPDDEERHTHRFQAILNKADRVAAGEVKQYVDYEAFLMDVYRLGKQEVRYVDTGCGPSGKKQNPFSVSEFGIRSNDESESEHSYNCPKCGKEYADETAKAPEERTKECSCGFKFNC